MLAALVSTISVVGSLIVTWLVVPDGLTKQALYPAILVPLIVAPVTTVWVGNTMLRIQRLNTRLEYLVRHDHMTGLWNRRHFFEQFSKREGDLKGAITVFDIDQFKSINDAYGHQTGDIVICDAARTIKAFVEPDGFVARFGGEEFVSFCPNETLQLGTMRAEKIRNAIEERSVEVKDGEVSYTLSAGVTHFDGVRNVDDALKEADKALYLAKNAGRNKIEAI